jgi:hypothetical protein
MSLDFIIGYLLGKRARSDRIEVDKKSCQHRDCPYWHVQGKCYTDMCAQHIEKCHPERLKT